MIIQVQLIINQITYYRLLFYTRDV